MIEEFKRPDPDKLLQAIQEEQTPPPRTRGFLKVFLGYIAGVGKTYRMLSEAQECKRRGKNIVIGVVETHKRAETEELTKGLDVIPRRIVDYGGISLAEMDIDEILRIKPEYVLVDELAHSNPPGFRHPKRCQDVEELLNAGIHVFTTLNVQHIESLKDIVKEITGIEVKEPVPDSILSLADKIELVDLPTEELLQRLAEGKVYIPEKAKQATGNFFREGNLLALRDLALRYAARKVEDVIQLFAEKKGGIGLFDTTSRIMVCVSPSPSSQHLVRLTYRFADNLNAEWFAVYVEPLRKTVKENFRLQLEKNLQLAERLGAKVVRLTGSDQADEVTSFAKSRHINLIIAGFSKRNRIERFFRGSFINKIINKSSPAQVLVVEGGTESTQATKTPTITEHKKFDCKPIASAFLSVALTTIACLLLRSFVAVENLPMIFVLPVVLSGALMGRKAGIIASVLAVAAFDFFFILPYYSFSVHDLKFIPTFAVLFIVGAVSSFLADLVRLEGEKARQRERFFSSLYDLSKNLLVSRNREDFLSKGAQYLSDALDCDVILLMPEPNGGLTIAAKAGNVSEFTAHDFGVAIWVFEHDQRAGRGTDTLSSSHWYYVPLKFKDRIFGVLGIGGLDISLERQRLIESWTNMISLGLLHYTQNNGL
ncbi:MAG: DUF4118 domain-containing protein [Phycisphaerae bacterium]